MKLLTEELIKKFEDNPLYSHEGEGMNAKVIVKFFNPCGAGTWLITEASETDGDWLMFGYVTLDGKEWEWGYVSLNELQSVKLPLPGLTIERDLYTELSTVEEMVKG